jgi:phosphopantetheinyl transferase
VICELQKVYEARVSGAELERPVARVALARLDTGQAGYRAQQRAARELLTWLARLTLGGAANSFGVRTSATGQPELLAGEAPLAVAAVSVSLSHSADWIAAGLARDGRLGIDVERENPRRRIAAMADWMGWPDCREPDTFYRAWTYREARIKCDGGELPPNDAAPLPPAANDVPGLHHAFCIRPAPGVHGCFLVETAQRLRLAWSEIEARRPATWS